MSEYLVQRIRATANVVVRCGCCPRPHLRIGNFLVLAKAESLSQGDWFVDWRIRRHSSQRGFPRCYETRGPTVWRVESAL